MRSNDGEHRAGPVRAGVLLALLSMVVAASLTVLGSLVTGVPSPAPVLAITALGGLWGSAIVLLDARRGPGRRSRGL